MPATDSREDQQKQQIFSILFWVGVALAPIAALMLLVSSGTGGLKGALGVVILSVILIGVSIILRRDGDGLRGELEQTVFDEIDAVRADVRADLNQAAQATHRAFGEKMQYLLDQIETTRAELEATRVQVDALRNGFSAPAATHRAPAQGPSPMPVHQATGRAGIPPGVVRHTETVQVTTRHTIMDPQHEEPRGTTYGSSRSGGHRGGALPPPREESWTEQRLREQFERHRDEPEERWAPPREREPVRESYEDDDRRPGIRAGDRWASVRSDDHGRELRMGERRAALHSDSSGTELRIEDRWAAVRREEGLGEPRIESSWRFEDGRLTDARSDHRADRSERPDRSDHSDRSSRTERAGHRAQESRYGRSDRSDEGRYSESRYEADRLDVPRGDFPYRDRSDRGDRRAITSGDREERWSDYQRQDDFQRQDDYQRPDYQYEEDRGYDRRYR